MFGMIIFLMVVVVGVGLHLAREKETDWDELQNDLEKRLLRRSLKP